VIIRRPNVGSAVQVMPGEPWRLAAAMKPGPPQASGVAWLKHRLKLLPQQAVSPCMWSGAQWRFFTCRIGEGVCLNFGRKKAPPLSGEACIRAANSASGDQSLARTLDHGLQRLGAGVLIGVQALAVTSDTVFVDNGEAEAAFASGHDQAVHWCEGVGQCMDSVSLMSSHD
jgi:hypothetical protein